MNIFNNISQPEVLWLAAYLLIAALIGMFLYWALISNKLKALRNAHQEDQDKIRKLSAENEAINAQISVHRADNKRLELGYAELENTNRGLSSNNEALGGELVKAKNKEQQLKNKEEQLRKQLQEQYEELVATKTNFETAQQTINKLNVANSEAATKIEFLESEVASLKAQNDELEVRRQTELGALNTQLAASQSSLSESNNYILGIPEDTKELLDEVDRLKAELETVQASLAATKEQAEQLEAERDSYKGKFTYTAGELAALKTMYGSTQDNFIALKTQRDKMDAYSAEANTTNEEKLIALEADLMSMEMAYNNVKKDLDLMVAGQIDDDAQISSLKEELDRVNGELSAMKAMYDSTQDDFIALKSQRDKIDAHSEEVASEQEEKMTTLHADMESMEMAYNNIKQDMDVMVAEREANEAKVVALQTQVERLETEKKIQEELIQFWKEDYEKLKKEYEDDPELEITKLQLNQLKVRLTTLQEEKEVALEEAGHLKDEMRKLKTEYDDDPELEVTRLQIKQMKLRMETILEDKGKAEEEVAYLKEELEKQRSEYEDDPELAITQLQNKQLKQKVELLEEEIVSLQANIAQHTTSALSATLTEPNAIVIPNEFPTEEESAQAKSNISDAMGKVLPKADVDAKDDLTKINGIGRFLEKQLNGIGIYTYEQVSLLDSDLIQQVTTAIGYFPGRIEKDAWVAQAVKLSKKEE